MDVTPTLAPRHLARIDAAPGGGGSSQTVSLYTATCARLMHALTGVVLVTTDAGRWIVPPDHTLPIPAGQVRSVLVLRAVAMRSVYEDAVPGRPEALRGLLLAEIPRLPECSPALPTATP